MQGLGRTGSISAVVLPQFVKNQHPHRIISGLLSAAAPDGSGAVGPDGVSGRSLLDISIQEAAFPPEVVPDAGGNYVLRVDRWGDRSVFHVFHVFRNIVTATCLDPELQGVLTKISRNGHRTNVDVPFPAGVAVDKRGNVYVSTYSIAPDTGLLNPETNATVQPDGPA